MDPEKSSTKKGVEDANLNTIDELRHYRINAYGVSIEASATTNKTNTSSYPTAEEEEEVNHRCPICTCRCQEVG